MNKIKLEIHKPISFFRQLAEALLAEKKVTLQLSDVPQAYVESPANLCAKLNTRAGLNRVDYLKLSETITFEYKPKLNL